uniref:Uncharacterized protein n=1 Tax=Globisporangium ultimum (strain ATCC 200006 / CBS 805.95 / DAOM BR144) TaxID=431595 RepID=K3WWL4_GLOUD
MRRLYVALNVAQVLSLLVAIAMLLIPAAIGRWLAILQCCLQLLILLMSVCALRVDLLRCMILTYEFWFFLVVNIANCIGLAGYLGDLRMVMLITYWLGVQMNICVDANLQARQVADGSSHRIRTHKRLSCTTDVE